MNDEKELLTAEKLVGLWIPTGLLKDVPKDRLESVVSAIEGQRRHNEVFNTSPQFKRISLPLMLRVVSALPKLKGSLEKCRFWHVMNVRWPLNDLFNYTTGQYSLDREAKSVMQLKEMIVDELRFWPETKVHCLSVWKDDQLLLSCE